MSDEEFVLLKRLEEKRGRMAAQVTVTPVSTVQYCIPRLLDPEMSPDVCVSLESHKSKIDPELTELKPPSAGTGLETPGQQCPPNEGIWEKGRTIAEGYLLVGMGSNKGGDISSPTEHAGTRAGTAATPEQPRHKTTSEENKQFDPGGKGEKAPPWNAAIVLLFFSWGERSAWSARCFLLVFFFCLSVYLLCFFFLLSGDHFLAS